MDVSTYKQLKEYIVSKPEVTLTFPFGDDVSVFKVKNKMFATLSVGKMGKGTKDNTGNTKLDWWMNLKCDPDEAVMLRDIFPSVIPGYHMNKKHWNTLILDDSIPQGEIERMIDNSFMLVVNNMPTEDQQSILLHLS